MTESRRSDTRPLLLAIGIFATLSVAAALSSEGFLEADACTHYLFSRFAFQQPDLFINIWGRPICTGLYALPALVAGRFGVQLTSLALAIGCGLAAWEVARRQGYRWPALALIFTLAQPLVFLHSFSELTELPFAFIIGLALLAYQRRQWLLFAVIVSLSPLSRPEGFGFLGLAALALLLHRRAWWLLVLPIPLVLWSYAGWRFYGREGTWWLWLPQNWPYSAESLYKPGPIWHFLVLMPVVTSPIMFPALCIGVWQSLRALFQRGIASVSSLDHTTRCQALIAIIPLLILFGHSVLYAFGKMASNGEIRYMLVVAPFWGLLSAYGWEWVFTRLDLRRPLRWAAVAAMLPGLANIAWGVVPLRPDEDWLRAKRAADWYQTSGIAQSFPRIGAAHPAIFYVLDHPSSDANRTIDWRQDTLAAPTPGTLLVFDPVYSVYNSDANRRVTREDLHAAGWIEVTDRAPRIADGWAIFVSPTDGSGSDARETPYFPSTP